MVFIRYLGESLVDSPLKLKRDPFALGASAVAGGASIGNNLLSLAHSDIANKKARKWMEEMYNKYSSPAAMMRQYKEAGVNPYLAGSSLGQGMSANAQANTPNLSDPGQAIAGGMSSGSMAAQVNSLVGNQKAEAFQKVSNGITNLLEKGSPQMAESFLQQMLPELKAVGFDTSQVTQLFGLQIQEWNCRNTILGIEADWQKQFGFDYRSTQFMKLNQELSHIVGQLNLMSTESDLNKAKINQINQDISESVSRIARNFADAFMLKQEGNYFIASANTANQIRSYLVDQFILGNGNLAVQLLSGQSSLAVQQAGQEIKEKQAADPVLQGVKFALETLGNVIHVNGGFNWSNLNGTMNSTNRNMNSGSLYSGDGYYMNNGILMKGSW